MWEEGLSQEEITFVPTMEGNKAPYTKHQLAAQQLYARLSYPSEADFKWILRSNQIKDCPVTVCDAEIAFKVLGPNVTALKGKTTWKTPDPVVKDVIQVLKKMSELHIFLHYH